MSGFFNRGLWLLKRWLQQANLWVVNFQSSGNRDLKLTATGRNYMASHFHSSHATDQSMRAMRDFREFKEGKRSEANEANMSGLVYLLVKENRCKQIGSAKYHRSKD